MSISLKVKFPEGLSKHDMVSVKLRADLTVEEAVAKILREAKISGGGTLTMVVSETNEWLEPKEFLAKCNFGAKLMVQLMPLFVLVSTTCYNGTAFSHQTLPYNQRGTVADVLPYLARRFKVSPPDSYRLYLDSSTMLPPDESLTGVPGASLLFRDPSVPMDETELRIYHDLRRGKTAAAVRDHAAATAQTGSGLNLESPAKTLLMNEPSLNGFISKLNKKKKFDRLFGIVYCKHLFVYRSQNETRPLFTITLKKFEFKEPEVKKKIPNAFELVPIEDTKKEERHLLKADNPQWFKQWSDILKPYCKGGEQVDDPSTAKKGKGKEAEQPKVFGRPLKETVTKQDGSELPAIVSQTISWIDKHALKSEGIFRLSGSATEIQEYKAKYDNGDDVTFQPNEEPDNVAGLLKLYFREMPEPIMTFERYFHFIMTDMIENRWLRLKYLKHLLTTIPDLNLALLKYLVAFLIRVSEHSDVNKMAIHNLATVFGPNLLKQEGANMLQLVEHTPQINAIVDSLIKYYDYLFDDGPIPEDLGDKYAGDAAKAIYDYEGKGEDDLSFKTGDIIHIIYQGNDGWWQGEHDDSFGKFPATYVQVLTKQQRVKAERKTNYHMEMKRLARTAEREGQKVAELETKRKAIQQRLNKLEQRKHDLGEAIKPTVQHINSVVDFNKSTSSTKTTTTTTTTSSGGNSTPSTTSTTTVSSTSLGDIANTVSDLCKHIDEYTTMQVEIKKSESAYRNACISMEVQAGSIDAEQQKKKKPGKDNKSKVVQTIEATRQRMREEESARRRQLELEEEVKRDLICLRTVLQKASEGV